MYIYICILTAYVPHKNTNWGLKVGNRNLLWEFPPPYSRIDMYIYTVYRYCTLYNTQVNPVCCLFYAHVQLYMYSTCTMYMYKCTNCTVCTVRVINCLYASFTNSNVIFCIYITYGNMLNVHRTMHFYIVWAIYKYEL